MVEGVARADMESAPTRYGVFADRGDYKYFVLFVVHVSVRRLRKPSPAGKVADGEAGKPRLSDG